MRQIRRTIYLPGKAQIEVQRLNADGAWVRTNASDIAVRGAPRECSCGGSVMLADLEQSKIYDPWGVCAKCTREHRY